MNYYKAEKSIVQDRNFLYTVGSYFAILLIFTNLNSFQSPFVGLMASGVYLIINAVFLGNAFFSKESAFFRLMIGILLLIMLLGFIGWLAVIIYNLDVIRFTLVLSVVATFCTLMNRKVRNGNGT